MVTNSAVRHGTNLLKYIYISFVIIVSPSFRWFWGPPTQNHRVSCYRCWLVAYPAATDSPVLFSFSLFSSCFHLADGKLLLTCSSAWTAYRCGKVSDVLLPEGSYRLWWDSPMRMSMCWPKKIIPVIKHLGVSKVTGAPLNGWCVMKNPIKMDDFILSRLTPQRWRNFSSARSWPRRSHRLLLLRQALP